MVSYPAINLVDLTIDEVALEGLDGITIEALWQRIALRFRSTVSLTEAFTNQIWSICVQVNEFAFFELQIPREPLVIFDRYEYVDPDLGIILEPENVPVDIYPHCPIQDFANGIKGSCSSYYTRKDVTNTVRSLSLHEAVEKYGQRLVIVASQSAREHALMGVEICPTLELNVTQYCFLERVGRSRYHGEVTQGKLSLNALKEDPKGLFYHRKFLLRHKLITKQIHHQKSSGHSCNGSLLHLPRFFVERKPKVIFLAEQVIEILKSKPNYVAEYDEIKRKLQIENSIKKLFKTSFFQKVVRTDLRVPYRTLYPNAEPKESQQKSNPTKEKMIKVVQLLVPDTDITEALNKDEIQEEDDPQELDISDHKYNVPYLKQANDVIEASGNDGVCQGSLARTMGLTKLQSRTILRNMIKTKIVATYMNDVGRQRVTKFVSKKFEKGSKMSKQFIKEMHKIKELTKHITPENDDHQNNKLIIVQKSSDVSIVDQTEIILESDSFHVATTSNENNSVPEQSDEPNVTAVELAKIFHAVNRILYKYRLTKSITTYKCTFPNVRSRSTNKEQSMEDESGNNVPSIIPELSNNQKATSLYKTMKTNLIALKPSSTGKPVNERFGFMEDLQNSEKKNVSNITYTLLRRANMIIESVKDHQVIDDMTKLMKMIHEEETKEGYDVKIDKKSLIRLLQKLAKDNLVKVIKLTLSGNGREKHLTFICDPNIDTNHTIIQSAVEQAKLKFCLLGSQKSKLHSKRTTQKLESCKKYLQNSEIKNKSGNKPLLKEPSPTSVCSKYNSIPEKRYGCSPKFIRMKTLHIFLYYLVYDHPGERGLSQKELIQGLRSSGYNISDELTKEFNTIYTTDVSWKMFVPPLPKYSGWPKGWTLMCDVLLRIPLSIFVKLHYIPHIIPEVYKYLNHPIKKYYLVKDLPVDIRNSLLFGRKYIFNIHETATRLCYIGLTQFGPQRLKEKDQVFIYVNRQTELMDTTSSAPSYHIIEDKSYPVIKYKFNEIEVVEKYWYDMWNTCVNTSLGLRRVVQGKDILLEELGKKAEMIKAVTARSPEEAVRLDTGHVPGDRKGAAGIDSACFAHLKRNWSWSLRNNDVISQGSKKQGEGRAVCEREAYLSKIKAKPIKFTDFSGLKKVSGPPSVNATDLRKKTHQQHDRSGDGTHQQKSYEAIVSHQGTKQKSFVRRVLPRKCNYRRRTKYDEIDYRALQRMHKLRVDWDSHEDKILLVCKVAMMYLCPNPRKQLISFSAVRDTLRSYSPTSYNKTSKACQRRLLYMLRKQQTVNSVALGVEEIKQNYFITKRFNGITEKIKEECKNSNEYDKRIADVFKMLVSYIAKKYYDISEIGPKEPLPVPTTAQEFNVFYKTVHPTKPFSNRGFNKDVRNVNDIHSATINSVIHSSMCCGKDRRSWAFQLLKVFEQYPEALLRNAMSKIRADQMVTIKKNDASAIRKHGHFMPMSSSQYQLSSNYIYKLQNKWPYNIFKEAYNVFWKLISCYCENQRTGTEVFNGTEVLPVTGGLIGAVHDFIVQNRIDFDVEIPDQVIMLDPRLKEKDETYFRIAQRYQDVLASLDHLKLVKAASFQNGSSTSESVQDNVPHECVKSKTTESCDTKFNDTGNADNTDMNLEKGCDEKVASSVKTIDKKENIENEKNLGDLIHLTLNYTKETCNVTNKKSSVITFQGDAKIALNIDHSKYSTTSVNKSSTMKGTAPVELCPESENENELSKCDSVVLSEYTQEFQTNVKSLSDTDSSSELVSRRREVPSKKRSRDTNETNNLDSDEPMKKKNKHCGENINYVEASGDKYNIGSYDKGDVVLKEVLPDDEHNFENGNFNAGNNNDHDIKHNDADKSNTEVVTSARTVNASELTNETGNMFTRVSDILRNMSPDQSDLNSYCKLDDTSDMQKRYTRIALLRMREELSELTAADSHHAHEYFVVNMFKIYYSLHALGSQHSKDIEDFKGLSIPSELLPLRINKANDLIREVNKLAIFPKENISYSEFMKTVLNTSLNLDDMDTLYKFVRDKKEIGATTRELTDKFQSFFGENLYRMVELLTENHLFLRSGITTVRYIHHQHANPWLICSYKVYRLDKESHLPMPQGAVYVIEPEMASSENTNDTAFAEIKNDQAATSVQKTPEIPMTESTASNLESELNIDEESDLQVKKPIHRRRTRLQSERDMPRTAKEFDPANAEEIKVAIKPWIRVDGVLNRRVLDRMLGAVLTYCLTHPGITLAKVQSRFVPALQPFHTWELIEMLIKLECLERKLLHARNVTLFSKQSNVISSNPMNNWAAEGDVFLEPAVGALVKFGIFLSTKMYNSEFIP